MPAYVVDSSKQPMVATGWCRWCRSGRRSRAGVVQRVMGHASASTTLDLYVHPSSDQDDAVRAILGREPLTFCWLLSPSDPARAMFVLVELRGFEPLTPSLRTRCATSCATAPCDRRG